MGNSSGRRALVCGASKGIGRAAALELSKTYRVTALARDTGALEELRQQMGEGHDFCSLDFSDASAVSQFLERSNSEYSVLVLNSGGPASGPLTDADVREFQKAFDQHLYFNHRLLQKMLPYMKKEKFGRIITVLSTSVKAPLPNLGVSNVLRAAMAAWVKTLAGELGPFGITLNNVLPGATDTERLGSLLKNAADKRKLSEQEVQKEWIDAIPARRFAKPEETAAAIAFLASESASYINGINLPVDGGRLPVL